ncbi:MAG TPA: HAMP domain-containing sensor histidine kinase [Caulobacterales bacterium]|nr:HAMP domain-containing sensor histidine kinase [Caulobacterales bacterium]
MPRLSETWAAAGLAAVWLLAATGLTAATGGASSPLAASLLIAPALAFVLGLDGVLELGFAAVLGYGAAAALHLSFPEPPLLGPAAPLLTAAAILFGSALVTVAPPRGRPMSETNITRRVAEISHDLRTPLTHILGFAEMIEHQVFGPAEQRYVEYAGLIRASGNHLLLIVNDMLDLSRLEAGRYQIDLETFDARAIAGEVVRLAEDAARRKRLVLSAHMPDAPVTVRADPRALRRMLTNTVGNAVKFTPEGGRVTLEVRASGKIVTFDTFDTGPGIPEPERERLGRPFERGESGAGIEGTGLGLALVRALAELHGGSLSFHDAPGGGALVRIAAPIGAD